MSNINFVDRFMTTKKFRKSKKFLKMFNGSKMPLTPPDMINENGD